MTLGCQCWAVPAAEVRARQPPRFKQTMSWHQIVMLSRICLNSRPRLSVTAGDDARAVTVISGAPASKIGVRGSDRRPTARVGDRSPRMAYGRRSRAPHWYHFNYPPANKLAGTGWCRAAANIEVKSPRRFTAALITTTVREQHPRSHLKGAPTSMQTHLAVVISKVASAYFCICCIQLSCLHILHIFAYFVHINAYECIGEILMGSLHIFAYFVHIYAYLNLHIMAYLSLCIFLHIIHICAYKTHIYAYFENAYLCIFGFAYLCIFCAYLCIWYICIYYHICTYLFTHI